MDDNTLNGLLSSSLVTPNHLKCALESLAAVHSHIRTVIHQRRLPDTPLPDAYINLFMAQLAALDSNNFPARAGVGEREGRVFSNLVASRHFSMSHGVGRSGELDSHQPKAAGMSLLYPLCNALALDVCRAAGFAANHRKVFEEALVAPLSTGMALALVLRSITNETIAVRENKQKKRKEEETKSLSFAEGDAIESVRQAGNESEICGNCKSEEVGECDGPNQVVTSLPTSAPPAATEVVTPRYVVWCRIDQKTCLKCIPAAGLEPIVVNLRRAPPPKAKRLKGKQKAIVEKGMHRGTDCSEGREEGHVRDGSEVHQEETTGRPSPSTDTSRSPYFVQSHIEDIRAAILSCPNGGKDAVAAVLTTTSCFAPRLPDDVVAISRLCRELDIPHVINNAYGLQSKAINAMINSAASLCSSGAARVDAVIQSTDKNFMVPVGGSVIVGPASVVRAASRLYPGRASAAPIVDLFITLLAMGKQQYVSLAHTDRYALLDGYFRPRVEAFAADRGEEVVWDSRNDISFGMTLRYAWCSGKPKESLMPHDENSEPTSPEGNTRMISAAVGIGSKLFHLGVTGPKVVFPQAPKGVSGIQFVSYGMHGLDELENVSLKPTTAHGDDLSQCGGDVPPMIIFACAIGMVQPEVDTFLRRLSEIYPIRK